MVAEEAGRAGARAAAVPTAITTRPRAATRPTRRSESTATAAVPARATGTEGAGRGAR